MSLTLQTLFQEHYEAFRKKHRVSREMARAAWCVMHCRTRRLGGHVNSCPHGHFHQIAYNSCRHRCCPQCGWLSKERWLKGWKHRLLPCPHHHIVFTVPHQLNELWRFNRSVFSDALFAAASRTLVELLADPKYLGARPGILSALHTWNQQLQPHVHLHVIITAGGLSRSGYWVLPQKTCLLPGKVLMLKFRGKFKALLRQKYRKGLLQLPPGFSATAFDSLLWRATRNPWNLRVFDAYRDGATVTTYLARYIKGGPIGNTRLLGSSKGRITFRYRLSERNGGDGKRTGLADLPVETFIGRWLQHVPPHRYQTVRGYGLYSGNQHSLRTEAFAALGGEPSNDEPLLLQASWQQLCEAAGVKAPFRCPHCGEPLIRHHEFAYGRDPPMPSVKSRSTVSA